MCITSAEIRAEEEGCCYNLLCENCEKIADKKMGEDNLFDIPMEDYGFCASCVDKINAFFDEKNRLENDRVGLIKND